MGDVFFKNEWLLKKHKVEVFSSNYTLYGDISRRVHEALNDPSPTIPHEQVMDDIQALIDRKRFNAGS